jgi:phage terminase large subunit-like protein
MTKRVPRVSSPDPRVPGAYFDEQAAKDVLIFFDRGLQHVKGELAGAHLVLDEWQRDVLGRLFGWKRADGTRVYRTAYIEVPRKNGKSTLGAGIALYLLYADGEPGAEVYSAAADRDQAAIVFGAAKQMVEANPKLAGCSECYRRSIVFPEKSSTYQVLSADAPTKHGKNAHGVIFDELHAQPNRELWDVLKTSTGSRRQPLVVALTTAGYDRHSICWELHEHARKVIDGALEDDSFFAVIYAADKDDDWTAPATWARANPGLGKSIRMEYLSEECARAQELPASENTFRRLHLNQWTEQADRWIPMALWDRNAGDVSDTELVGRPVFMGLDLASTTDLTALAKLFPLEDGRFVLRVRFWMPEENVRRRVERDRVPYDVWIREGVIEATPGNIVDYDVVRTRILEEAGRHQLRDLAYDRWNAIHLITQLQEEWPERQNPRDGPQVVPFGQGWQSMSAPTKEFEKLLLGGKLLHGGNPVLRWMAANVAVKQDPAGNMKPDKASSTERIDGIVAAIMALGRAMVRPSGTSVYEERGIVEI